MPVSTNGPEDIPDLTGLPTSDSRLIAPISRFVTDRRVLERKYPIHHSAVTRDRLHRFLTGWAAAVQQTDFESLTSEERIDHILFRNHIGFCLRRLERRTAEEAEMAPLIPFAGRLVALEEARRAMEWVAPEAAAAELNAIAAEVAAAQARLEADPDTVRAGCKRTVANRAAEAVSELHGSVKEWYAFYHGFDPLFTWWAEAPFVQVDNALKAYRELIQTTMVNTAAGDAADIIGDPIGREALSAELQFEMISYSPEELIEIARRELDWCEAELKSASAEVGFGSDTRAAVEHVKNLHVPPGGQPELVKSLALEAIAYLDEHDLLTVPPLARETWRLEMMSAKKQKVNPFFLGGEVIQVSFPTDTMSHEEKMMSMRGNNAHFSRATVQHELIPGHHLQGFMQERHRTYRRPFGTPFWIEGWTIYWELLLYHMGFPKSPEDRIGMLFWRIHRCVRIIFSLGFHLETMTPQECVEMLVERVGHERANAVAEVRRSCSDAYPPLYQAAYMIGGLQMWALRKELVETGKMNERQFHDAVIQQNSIPIEMVRASLLNNELNSDFRCGWRFYGEL